MSVLAGSAVDSWLPGGSDTIAALSTATGRAAIAVIRISGPSAYTIARAVLTPWRRLPLRTTYLATLHHPADRSVIDHPLITVYEAPSSYTGEDLVEVALHGGVFVPALALGAVIDAGARMALPGEFTRRAVVNGKIDLIQAEAIGDLIDTQSRTMHRAALAQLDGNLSARVEGLRQSLLHLEALIAYDIDFPEEDHGLINPARIADASTLLLGALDRLLATACTGETIRHGSLVVIIGAPNVGKSSLFNALIGSTRAIVTEIPGTTRDAVEAVVDFGESPARLVDTAGIHETHDRLERLGIEVSERYLRAADLVLACGDSVASVEHSWWHLRSLTEAPAIAVGTKADLQPNNLERPPVMPVEVPFVDVSAKSGFQLDVLSQEVESVLKKTRGAYEQDTPLLTRDRHRCAIQHARDEIAAFQYDWSSKAVPASVSAVHLRAATGALEELIGRVDTEDVLAEVFRSFCVGK